MNLLMFGCPGVGKGTQAKLLAKSLGVPHHSTGDTLRDAVEQGTEAGKIAAAYMELSQLVPDEVLSDIVEDVIHNSNGFILDGYPRNHQQVKYFFETMRTESLQLTKIIHLVADRRIVTERMLNRGRNGENADSIAKRLNVYKEETFPALEMFPPDKLITIESVGDAVEVNKEILSQLTQSFS
jgi:adenylate kinase